MCQSRLKQNLSNGSSILDPNDSLICTKSPGEVVTLRTGEFVRTGLAPSIVNLPFSPKVWCFCKTETSNSH